MKPWTRWIYGLGLSGALALGPAGCGGGDVPDPGSDELAADEGDEAAAESAMPPPPIQAPPPAADAAAPPAAPGAAPAPGLPPGPAPGADSTAPAADAPAADAPAGDAPAGPKSETAELLAAATGAAVPELSLAEAPGTPGAPGFPGAPGYPGAPGAEPDAGQLAYPGAMNPNAMNGPGGPGNPYAPAGDNAMEGGPGGASQLKEGDSRSPRGAVEAFLYALSHKDRDRLAEATALRANTMEEGGKHRELFSRIIDYSISDAELDDLVDALDDYRVSGENKARSTGRLGVTIRKTKKGGGWIQRTVTVRHEKKGWGVLDISDAVEFNQARSRNMRQQQQPRR